MFSKQGSFLKFLFPYFSLNFHCPSKLFLILSSCSTLVLLLFSACCSSILVFVWLSAFFVTFGHNLLSCTLSPQQREIIMLQDCSSDWVLRTFIRWHEIFTSCKSSDKIQTSQSCRCLLLVRWISLWVTALGFFLKYVLGRLGSLRWSHCLWMCWKDSVNMALGIWFNSHGGLFQPEQSYESIIWSSSQPGADTAWISWFCLCSLHRDLWWSDFCAWREWNTFSLYVAGWSIITVNGSRSRWVSAYRRMRTWMWHFWYGNMSMGGVQRKSKGTAFTALLLLVHMYFLSLLQNCALFFFSWYTQVVVDAVLQPGEIIASLEFLQMLVWLLEKTWGWKGGVQASTTLKEHSDYWKIPSHTAVLEMHP